MRRVLAALTLLLTTSLAAPAAAPQSRDELKSAPAYGALVARRAAVESELAGLLESYTPAHPLVAGRRAELRVIRRELKQLAAVSPRRLTAAYGDLLLRKVALEVELHNLLNLFTPQHPDVKLKRAELAAVGRALADLSR
jgi:uncharacterized protein involved in exopolysaccharide biosynthesis